MSIYTQQLYIHYAELAKIFAAPRRLELLELLSQAPRSVESLSRATGMSVANTSQHLQQLYRARLVTSTRQGHYIIYQVASPQVQQFLHSLATLAHTQGTDVQSIEQTFQKQWGHWQTVDAIELQNRLGQGALLIDVRPIEEFAAGHIPGAISQPLASLSQQRAKLPKQHPVIAYCRGPYCVFALEALELLSSHQGDLMHYRGGYAEYLSQQASAIENKI